MRVVQPVARYFSDEFCVKPNVVMGVHEILLRYEVTLSLKVFTTKLLPCLFNFPDM